MTFRSLLIIKANPGQAEQSTQAFIQRRCIEESAETIPGFQHGELMRSTTNPEFLCVLCSWDHAAAYQQWLDSPVRAKQGPDLAGAFTDDIQSWLFETIHTVEEPQLPSP
jgi:heme-degrading monooxygenase HmoA